MSVKEPFIVRVPVPHTPHEVVLCGTCGCRPDMKLADNPPMFYDVMPEYYDHLHEAYVAFMVHWLRRATSCSSDGERYWAVHWGDAHVIAVKDRRTR